MHADEELLVLAGCCRKSPNSVGPKYKEMIGNCGRCNAIVMQRDEFLGSISQKKKDVYDQGLNMSCLSTATSVE